MMKFKQMIKSAAALVLVSLLAISCGRAPRERLAIAYVIDMTASVDRDAIQQAFAALEPLLHSGKLKRGDSITIIPITGDTLTEAQGKIIRIHLPEKRAVYDSDLSDLIKEVQGKLERMQAEATTKPYLHSDILGAANLAAEELATEKGNVRKVIVILSDFIQDDSRFNFNTSSDLANDLSAVALAKTLSANHKDEFAGTSLYLGMLRSKDLKKMPNARREAVQTFWQEYLKQQGTEHVSLAIDGPGKIPTVLNSD